MRQWRTRLTPCTGSSTDISIGHISCPSCDGVASVETWLVDNSSAQAFKCGGLVCWIEAGYAEKPITTQCGSARVECYFWGDNRPNSILYYHPYAIPSDNYGDTLNVFIENDTSSSWYIDVYPLNSLDGGFTGYSSSDTIYPQNIRIGSELGGTSGVSIPTQSFSYNEWSTNYNFYYQTNAGCGTHTLCLDNQPPTDFWALTPNCCNSGGNFQVSVP